MSDGTENHLVFAAMRNEGAFLLEWVVWYRMLGFDILVGINDCTDRSPELLGALQDAGWLRVFEHVPQKDQPPKISAYNAFKHQPEVAEADWLLICDVDEFLVLHRGDGTIGGYLDEMGRDFLGLAFHWKCFGNSGWKRYQPGLVHRQFKRCGVGSRRVNAFFKTLVRAPRRFRRFSDHFPVGFDGDMALPENRVVDCELRPIDAFATGDQPVRFTDPAQITHATAQMNHYVIRSDESFDLKRGTPSASAFKDRYTDQFYKGRNRNGMKDTSALRHKRAFDRIHAEALALPNVRRLHHLCVADYIVRLCENQGLPPENDSRWQAQMAAAFSCG